MEALSTVYKQIVCQLLYQKQGDGSNFGTGLVVALRPPFKRFNSFRRGGSQRLPRRPASLLAHSAVVVAQCDENGPAKSSNSEGPAGWATSFEKLLEDPLGLHTFAEFLKKEFSAENIYFWTACERYRRLSPGSDRVAEAQRIYQQHLSVGAPEGVNVDSHGRHCTEQALQEASVTLFDQAQKQILNLMKFDSYPRFLKSTLYKQCLSGEAERPQLDAGLLVQPPTLTKLKKSLSNAEDRRRKSLLPWHRKIRSKSKDRGEMEYSRGSVGLKKECENGRIGGVGSDTHSSKSSLTSLDVVVNSTQDSLKNSVDENAASAGTRGSLCRVLLSNGSTTVVQIRSSETIEELVTRLLEKRGIVYSAFEVYTDKHPKAINITEPSDKLSGCEVTIEQRVVFHMDLPNKKVISVKSKSTKMISEVLRPILRRYNYNFDQVHVTQDENVPVQINKSVTTIDQKRLKVSFEEIKNVPVSNPIIKVNKTALDEITNQVFENILYEKSDTVHLKPKSDRGSVKSEDWGSEHSSGIFGKLLRKDSGIAEKKKKQAPKIKVQSCGNTIEEGNDIIKKPLIAKWKTGVNKFQVSCSESDELVEGLTRAQRSRLEDQRGTKINFELPDFLKDKDEQVMKLEAEKSRFYVECSDDSGPLRGSHYNYENRNIITKDFNSFSNNNSSFTNQNNLTVYLPLEEESFKSNSSILLNSGNLEDTVIENKRTSSNCGEPPPLPPKPKIVPIKPRNWGQNGFYKSKEISSPEKKTLYLEQPSSSFV